MTYTDLTDRLTAADRALANNKTQSDKTAGEIIKLETQLEAKKNKLLSLSAANRKLKALLLFTLLFTSCTENERARNYGGTEIVELTKDQRLENVTWKGDDLWILTRTVKPGDPPPCVHLFSEKSSWGIWEGEIRIVEK